MQRPRQNSGPHPQRRTLSLLFGLLMLVSVGLLEAETPPESRDSPDRPGDWPAGYRPGALLLRDDPDGTLESTLTELARRRSGRRMIERLLDSGFVTVLVSQRLRLMQAGLWGPIFHRGRIVGASLYLDLAQIRGLDHDPTGVETLAHELRHQMDAARAFGNRGTYEAIYLAARSGDRTASAQRYAQRIRQQRPDLDSAAANRWLQERISHLVKTDGTLMARAGQTSSRP